MKKRMLVICLLLVVLIFLGCYDTEIDKLTGLPLFSEQKDVVKVAVQYEAELLKLAELRGNQIKLLEEEISLLKDLVEFQRGTIISLQNLCRIYEAAIKSLVRVIEYVERLLAIRARG